MNSKVLSEKLITHNKNNKVDFFVKSIIKDYKLAATKGDYTYDGKVFTLFNTNQYNFTDIRNETYRKGFEYIEE
jgi:hypothetical protein